MAENGLTWDICWKAADGTGEVEKLASASPDRGLYPCSWSSDAKNLVLSEQITLFQAGIETLSEEHILTSLGMILFFGTSAQMASGS